VVPANTFPPDWGSRTEDIPGYQDINRIMAAKPEAPGHRSLSAGSFLGIHLD
jgi:hypothetical protein